MKRVGRRSARRFRDEKKKDRPGKDVGSRVLVEEYRDIDFYNPSGAGQVDYGEARTFDFSNATEATNLPAQDAGRIELEEDTPVKVIVTENIKTTIDVKGHRVMPVRLSSKKGIKKARKELVKMSRSKGDMYEDARRNAVEYRMKCPACGGSGRCKRCHGKGRIWLIRKCPDCGGSGICRVCRHDAHVPCPNCGEPVNYLASSCDHCGHTNHCPECNEAIPFGATRCIHCQGEFVCEACDSPVAPGYEKSCPECGAPLRYH